MKIFCSIPIVLVVLVFTFNGLTNQAVAGSIWAEAVDAGELPGTAQVTVGVDPIDSITGNLSGIDDIDMFLLSIPNLSLFSATTVGIGTALFDTQLFLFDSAGMGVKANDDDPFSFDTNARIPAGTVTGSPGLYYLAVSVLGDNPVSGTGDIFDLFPPFEVFGPNGPGKADPISAWFKDGFSEPFSAYEITLTGVSPAVVPEPATLTLFSTGAILLLSSGWHSRKRKKCLNALRAV